MDYKNYILMLFSVIRLHETMPGEFNFGSYKCNRIPMFYTAQTEMNKFSLTKSDSAQCRCCDAVMAMHLYTRCDTTRHVVMITNSSSYFKTCITHFMPYLPMFMTHFTSVLLRIRYNADGSVVSNECES
jgi:hypothetical protein